MQNICCSSHVEERLYSKSPQNILLLLRIEERYLYIWTCQVKNFSGFMSITNEFYKFIHRHAKNILQLTV
jgi:hypothetical protein